MNFNLKTDWVNIAPRTRAQFGFPGDWESGRIYLFILVGVHIKCLTICMPNTTWLCIFKCTGSVCICIPRTEKNWGVDSHFDCLLSIYDCAASKMDILALSVPCSGFFSPSPCQYQETCGHGNEMVFSHALGKATMWLPHCWHWETREATGTCNYSIEAALCSGSPALY